MIYTLQQWYPDTRHPYDVPSRWNNGTMGNRFSSLNLISHRKITKLIK